MTSLKKQIFASVVPPWLWFWLIIYLISLPTNFSNWIRRFMDIFTYQNPSSDITGSPFYALLGITDFFEFIFPITLLIGTVSLLFPNQTAKKYEKQQNLKVRAIQPEIIKFLHKYAPRIHVRFSLKSNKNLANVYTLDYGKVAIAIFVEMVKLWQKDQPTAKATLLHELGHYLSGDAFIIGAGSEFRKIVSNWFYLYLLIVFIPIVIVYLSQTVTFFQEITQAGIGILPGVTHKISQIFIRGIPFFVVLLGQMLMQLLLTINVFIIPLIGIWCAEFNADQAVARNASPAEALKLIHLLSEKISWTKWLLSRLTHPPKRLRLWLVTQSHNWWSLFLLLLLFPGAYIVRLFMMIVYGIIASFMRGNFEALHEAIINYLKNVTLVWIFTAILLAIWPAVSQYWQYYLSGIKSSPNQDISWIYYLSAATVATGVLIMRSLIGNG
ncbi:hypothetical protein [Nostoc sp.]|uniref:hypothetical protein n=1 Tax=Nostoc sp. TaxID=1180 RepID=UPI002FFAD1EB